MVASSSQVRKQQPYPPSSEAASTWGTNWSLPERLEIDDADNNSQSGTPFWRTGLLGTNGIRMDSVKGVLQELINELAAAFSPVPWICATGPVPSHHLQRGWRTQTTTLYIPGKHSKLSSMSSPHFFSTTSLAVFCLTQHINFKLPFKHQNVLIRIHPPDTRHSEDKEALFPKQLRWREALLPPSASRKPKVKLATFQSGVRTITLTQPQSSQGKKERHSSNHASFKVGALFSGTYVRFLLYKYPAFIVTAVTAHCNAILRD